MTRALSVCLSALPDHRMLNKLSESNQTKKVPVKVWKYLTDVFLCLTVKEHRILLVSLFLFPSICWSRWILKLLMLTTPPLFSSCPHVSHETALCWLSTWGSLPQWVPPEQNGNAHCSKEIKVDIVDIWPVPMSSIFSRNPTMCSLCAWGSLAQWAGHCPQNCTNVAHSTFVEICSSGHYTQNCNAFIGSEHWALKWKTLLQCALRTTHWE